MAGREGQGSPGHTGREREVALTDGGCGEGQSQCGTAQAPKYTIRPTHIAYIYNRNPGNRQEAGPERAARRGARRGPRHRDAPTTRFRFVDRQRADQGQPPRTSHTCRFSALLSGDGAVTLGFLLVSDCVA
ncbi:hypothetical protein Shyhy02_50920 [Streptomyces hygroscopicus subsp. hygroscopicus]|nr:hypothetical protein Shyhy02_50920 [Streptomyces hygroscopicus subsp. hygroscopicus]